MIMMMMTGSYIVFNAIFIHFRLTMDSKEVKVTLKNAREAIRNKEFKDALQHCKVKTNLQIHNWLNPSFLLH